MYRKNNARDRVQYEVNAGSMADIAFLLLIFFLVTTTIVEDKGVLVKLPPWQPDNEQVRIKELNVFSVLVNADDAVSLRGQDAELSAIRTAIVNFISNPKRDMILATSPKKAVVSLQNDRGTKYKSYIQVYNEIISAYAQLWQEASLDRYDKVYAHCSDEERRSIRQDIPLIISEAEPTAFGVE